MLLLRIALSTFVLGISLNASNAQESPNPFAKWDQQTKKRTTQTDPFEKKKAQTRRAEKGAVEYFSAAPAENETKAPAAKSPNVRRERLQVKKTTPPADKRSKAAGANRNDVFASKSKTGDGSNVRSAAFTSGENNGAIQQTGADVFSDGNGGDANPFAEILGAPETDAEFVVPAPESAEPTFAEPAIVVPRNNFPAEPSFSGDRSVTEFTPDNSVAPVSSSGPQSPSVTLQWIHHDEFSVGQECRCDLVVENTGRASVGNVAVEAVLPAGLEVVRSQPAPVAQGGSARWSFRELEPGQKQAIELVVIPKQQGDVQLNAFVQITAATTSTLAVTQPMVAIKVDGPESVEMGQQLGYTVHVTNPGTGTARNVVIQAAIPEGLQHRQGSLLNIEIGTLNPGELRRARLSLTAIKGGDQELAVRVIADGNLAESSTQLVSVAEPRLNIGLRGPASRKTGQSCDFEVLVVNEGNVDSNNVRAKYKVPEGYDFVSADAGGKFNRDDQTIEWFVGTLEPEQIRRFRVTLLATRSGEGKHQVGVISEHGKMTLAEHNTTVEGSADLKLRLATSARQVRTGENTIFQVRIDNNGSSPATSVGLSCELPAGLELLDVSGPSEFIADNGVIIFRSLPSLEAGKSATFAISTRCLRAGNHKLRVRVASESISEPLIGEESAVGLSQ